MLQYVSTSPRLSLWKSCQTRSVVFTVPLQSATNGFPTCLRSYGSDILVRDRITIWQAARATSAAPNYFEPMPLALYSTNFTTACIDAAFGFNNPGETMLEEAKKIEDPLNGDYSAIDRTGLFLSIGTGLQDAVRLESKGFWEWLSEKYRVPLAIVKGMQAVTTSTEQAHRHLESQLSARPENQRYWRFNPYGDVGRVELDDHTRIAQMQLDTDIYMERVRQDRDRCASRALSMMSALPSSGEREQDEELMQRLQALRLYERPRFRRLRTILTK